MLELNNDGAALKSAALSISEMQVFEDFAKGASVAAGSRIFGNDHVQQLVGRGSSAFKIAVAELGLEARPVRAILFDKGPKNNWALGWHQDRTIVVKNRVETPGYGPWSRKSDLQHAEPPSELFETMVTIRIHLDAVDAGNAPLLIAKGSHKLGRVPVDQIASIVDQSDIVACLANSGDVWAYRPPILHASEAAKVPLKRRVLQVDYCAAALPGNLEWLGI